MIPPLKKNNPTTIVRKKNIPLRISKSVFIGYDENDK